MYFVTVLILLDTLVAVEMLLAASATTIVYSADLRENVFFYCEIFAILSPIMYITALTGITIAVDISII